MRIGKNAARGCYGCFAFGVILLACLFGMVVYINTRPITVTVPPYPHIKDNAYPLFVKAGRMMWRMKHPNPSNDPNLKTFPPPLRNYALAYKESLPALKLMESALNKPCLAPSGRSLFSKPSSGFAALRNLARVIGDDAEYLYLTGHYFQSAQLRLDGMEMGVMTARGGGEIPFLVDSAIEAIDMYEFENILPKLSVNQLFIVERRFHSIDREHSSISNIVLEEGNQYLTQSLQILHDTKTVNCFKQINMFANYENDNPTLKNYLHAVIFLFQNKNEILKTNQRYFQSISEEMKQLYHPLLKTKQPINFLNKSLTTSEYLLSWKFYTYETAYDHLLITEVAVYLYRKKTGHFPNSLQQLIPHYLPSIPEDPFHQNKPLIYRLKPNGKGFLLYSVGPDQIDNGGQPMKRPYLGAKGDMVAGYLRD